VLQSPVLPEGLDVGHAAAHQTGPQHILSSCLVKTRSYISLSVESYAAEVEVQQNPFSDQTFGCASMGCHPSVVLQNRTSSSSGSPASSQHSVEQSCSFTHTISTS